MPHVLTVATGKTVSTPQGRGPSVFPVAPSARAGPLYLTDRPRLRSSSSGKLIRDFPYFYVFLDLDESAGGGAHELRAAPLRPLQHATQLGGDTPLVPPVQRSRVMK